MTEYIKNPLSGKLKGVTYEDGKIIDVHIRDTDDVVKVFVPVRHGRWVQVIHIVRYVEKINLEGLMPMYGQIGNQIIAQTAVQKWTEVLTMNVRKN